MPSCAVCAAGGSSPANFLLTCSSCATSYHHRCHTPVLTDALLIDLVKTTTAVAKGFAPRNPKTLTLQNWTCAACQCAGPTLIDLTIDDSDGDKQSEDKVHAVEDLKPAVKAEELPESLPPRKYNIAPAWIHKQHAVSQAADAWDRLAAKNRSRRPRKVAQPAAKPFARQPFISVAPLWLESRRSTLPI